MALLVLGLWPWRTWVSTITATATTDTTDAAMAATDTTQDTEDTEDTTGAVVDTADTVDTMQVKLPTTYIFKHCTFNFHFRISEQGFLSFRFTSSFFAVSLKDRATSSQRSNTVHWVFFPGFVVQAMDTTRRSIATDMPRAGSTSRSNWSNSEFVSLSFLSSYKFWKAENKLSV